MDARVELGDGARALGSGLGFLGEFGVELLEGLHDREFYVARRAAATPNRPGYRGSGRGDGDHLADESGRKGYGL
jgi:hypothetical protein